VLSGPAAGRARLRRRTGPAHGSSPRRPSSAGACGGAPLAGALRGGPAQREPVAAEESSQHRAGALAWTGWRRRERRARRTGAGGLQAGELGCVGTDEQRWRERWADGAAAHERRAGELWYACAGQRSRERLAGERGR
jgi:hypothetical protein